MKPPAPRRWRSPVAALLLATAALSSAFSPALAADTTLAELRTELQVGDLVFIRVPALPFRKVAAATNSWTNHVGVVVETAAGDAADVLIAESTFPRARRSTLARFVARSEAGRVAVMRRDAPLTEAQGDALRRAADARMGIAYDTGFDLHSPRQFCSRFAREVIEEATGDSLGEVETFAHLLERNPSAGLGFWRVWYFGRIPWSRETVTPASLLTSPLVHTAFDGQVVAR